MIHNVVLRVSFQKELEYGNEIRNKTLRGNSALSKSENPTTKSTLRVMQPYWWKLAS